MQSYELRPLSTQERQQVYRQRRRQLIFALILILVGAAVAIYFKTGWIIFYAVVAGILLIVAGYILVRIIIWGHRPPKQPHEHFHRKSDGKKQTRTLSSSANIYLSGESDGKKRQSGSKLLLVIIVIVGTIVLTLAQTNFLPGIYVTFATNFLLMMGLLVAIFAMPPPDAS